MTVHRDRVLLHCVLGLFAGGPHGTKGGAGTWGEALGRQFGSWKLLGPLDSNMLSPTAVHLDRRLHYMSLPQLGSHVGCNWGCQHARMAWQHWTICGSSRLVLPGRCKWSNVSSNHTLAANSDLHQQPCMQLSDILNFSLDWCTAWGSSRPSFYAK